MKETETTEQSMYTIMREMDPNDKLIVTIDAWDLARNYALILEKNFKVKFSVKRMQTINTKRNFILVQRIS